MCAWGHSPAMIDAIYALLLVIVIALVIIGLLATFRWVDEKIEALTRWFQMAHVRERTNEDLQDWVEQLNERQR